MNQALKEYADWAEEEAAAPAEDPLAELARAEGRGAVRPADLACARR